MQRLFTHATTRALLGAFVIVAAACDSPADIQQHDHESTAYARVPANAATDGVAKQVHAATARFHATEQATRAGYVVGSPCVAVPGLGGMGFHWMKESLVDPVFNPLQPEAVLYAPDAQGNLHLVAVEYIVIDVGQEAPMFGDQPFDVGGTPVPVPHWSLHVWLHKANPAGMFAPFNPDVVCP